MKVTVEKKKTSEFKPGDIVESSNGEILMVTATDEGRDTFSALTLSESNSSCYKPGDLSGGWMTSKFSHFKGTIVIECE